MGENLLETYNPLYDVHLRQYFALPHMQKHLRNLGLLDGAPIQQNELHAGHVAMMDLMLRNRERVLQQLMDLQRKLDAAEKVELYRRIRSGLTNDEMEHSQHMSRSLSRPARSAAARLGGERRQRRQSMSPEAGDLIKRVEADYRSDSAPFKNPKSIYNRLAANVYKYQYLHKLDDRTLHKYMLSLRKQLAKLERFREVSFGPHTMAKHQPVHPQQSWFFRRRSLPSLNSANANHQNATTRAHTQQTNGRSPKLSGLAGHKPRSGKSQSPVRITGAVEEPPFKVRRRTSVSRTRGIQQQHAPPQLQQQQQRQQQRLPPLPKKRSFAATRNTPSSGNKAERLPPTMAAPAKPTRKAPPERRTPVPAAATPGGKKTPAGSRPASKGSATPVPVQKPPSAASGILPAIGVAAVAAAAGGVALLTNGGDEAPTSPKKADEAEGSARGSVAPSPSISLAASQTTTTDGGQAGGDSEWESDQHQQQLVMEGETAPAAAAGEVNGGTETRPTPEPFLEAGIDNGTKMEQHGEPPELVVPAELEQDEEQQQLTARASVQSPEEPAEERMESEESVENTPSGEEHPPYEREAEIGEFEHRPEEAAMLQDHAEAASPPLADQQEEETESFRRESAPSPEEREEQHHGLEMEEHSPGEEVAAGHSPVEMDEQQDDTEPAVGAAQSESVDGDKHQQHFPPVDTESLKSWMKQEEEGTLNYYGKPNFPETGREGEHSGEEHAEEQTARSKRSMDNDENEAERVVHQQQEAEDAEGGGEVFGRGLSAAESDQIRQAVHPGVELEEAGPPPESVRSLASSSVAGAIGTAAEDAGGNEHEAEAEVSEAAEREHFASSIEPFGEEKSMEQELESQRERAEVEEDGRKSFAGGEEEFNQSPQHQTPIQQQIEQIRHDEGDEHAPGGQTHIESHKEEEEPLLVDINGNSTAELPEGEHGAEHFHSEEAGGDVGIEPRAPSLPSSHGGQEEQAVEVEHPHGLLEGAEDEQQYERVKREVGGVEGVEGGAEEEECPPEGCRLPSRPLPGDDGEEEAARRSLVDTEEVPIRPEGAQWEETAKEEFEGGEDTPYMPSGEVRVEEQEATNLVDSDEYGGGGHQHHRESVDFGTVEEGDDRGADNHHPEEEEKHEEHPQPEEEEEHLLLDDNALGGQPPIDVGQSESLDSLVKQEQEGGLNYYGKSEWMSAAEEETETHSDVNRHEEEEEPFDQRRHSAVHAGGERAASALAEDDNRPATAESTLKANGGGAGTTTTLLISQPSIEITPASEYGGSVEESLASPQTRHANIPNEQPVVATSNVQQDDEHHQHEDEPLESATGNGQSEGLLTNGGGNGHSMMAEGGDDADNDKGVGEDNHRVAKTNGHGEEGDEENEQLNEHAALLEDNGHRKEAPGGNGHVGDDDGASSDATEGADEGGSEGEGSVIIHRQQQAEEEHVGHHQHSQSHQQQFTQQQHFQSVKLDGEENNNNNNNNHIEHHHLLD